MNNSTLTPVQGPVSLEKLAYDAIKAGILNFQLMPGETVVESELARQLGISKTPVRDALSRLEKEGFIQKTPYKGYTVALITKETVVEIFEIRAALEGVAARHAAEKFSEQDLATAQELLEKHRLALADQSIQRASQLNKQFHELILQKSGNQRLRQILSNLDEHLQRYRLLSNFQAGRIEKSVAEHNQIFEAIREKRAEDAETAARQHLLSVLEDLKNQDFMESAQQIHNQATTIPE
jgi:DNA-binding GntR family transcriptional regulator